MPIPIIIAAAAASTASSTSSVALLWGLCGLGGGAAAGGGLWYFWPRSKNETSSQEHQNSLQKQNDIAQQRLEELNASTLQLGRHVKDATTTIESSTTQARHMAASCTKITYRLFQTSRRIEQSTRVIEQESHSLNTQLPKLQMLGHECTESAGAVVTACQSLETRLDEQASQITQCAKDMADIGQSIQQQSLSLTHVHGALDVLMNEHRNLKKQLHVLERHPVSQPFFKPEPEIGSAALLNKDHHA